MIDRLERKRVTEFYIERIKDLDKWVGQNHGIVIDCEEGVLLDHELVECDRGLAVINEHYVNPWKSDYRVRYYLDRDAGYEAWDNFVSEYREVLDDEEE